MLFAVDRDGVEGTCSEHEVLPIGLHWGQRGSYPGGKLRVF